jgi:hypothetical protein
MLVFGTTTVLLILRRIRNRKARGRDSAVTTAQSEEGVPQTDQKIRILELEIQKLKLEKQIET